MANPRELAEKAISALQDALRDSENRATELDAELKRRRAPKNRLEERVEVLGHRLESVEADAERWRREAGHLEEVLENERAKIKQLKKKLEVAESGPDRLTKKEINFWRQRAEMFDAETREYKTRIAGLRKELTESRPVETGDPEVQTAEAAALAETLGQAEAENERLQARLTAQETQIGDLLDELESLRAARERAAAETSQTSAEIDSVTRQLNEMQSALRDAQHVKTHLTDRVAGLTAELGEAQDIAAEARTASERLQETVKERDSRLVSLSAELEKTRAELANRGERGSSLEDELEQARARATEQQHKAERLFAELDQARRDAAAKRDTVEAAQQRVAELEAELRDASEKIGSNGTELAERDHRIETLTAELAELHDAKRSEAAAAGEHERRVEEFAEELGKARVSVAEHEREIEQLRHQKHKLEAELSDLLSRSDESSSTARELETKVEELEQLVAHKDQALSAAQSGQAEFAHELKDAQEQIAGLEAELKEEKEYTENLSEVANERRETIVRLEEKLEEAQERYEEAKWRLGKAEHFERLVRRRKGLIASLLAAIRAKSKANNALKAGLDGLRRYKATAEANQHKLLARIDRLKAELAEVRDDLKSRQAAAPGQSAELEEARTKVAALEERLNTQAELIQGLESDLKTAKAMQQSAGGHAARIEELERTIAAKNEAITQLEADADEQQRKLAKLRGSESETMRLKGISEQDKSKIDALEREIAQLREALARKDSGSGDDGDLLEKLRERDSSIARLMGTVKEQEAKIAELNDASAKWKRKYEFLSTEAPSAYQSVAEK